MWDRTDWDDENRYAHNRVGEILKFRYTIADCPDSTECVEAVNIVWLQTLLTQTEVALLFKSGGNHMQTKASTTCTTAQ